ncbi:MAG: hypothetical protein JOZ75_01745 [Candidatus Dormibacteraeota bacterium]|nr:hypothetical protein [Candidatus Dormibacteraeota bacterium]
MAIVPQSESQKHTDQWFQWAAYAGDGTLAVSYYDRSYGDDITNGNMDVTLSTSNENGTRFEQTRVTSSSMSVPTEFPDAQGNSVFFGDYSGLAVGGDDAHPLWSDTREPDLIDCSPTGPPAVCTFIAPGSGDDQANNEDIFTAKVKVRGED